jgi:SAM-dependent methyltransferase
MFSDSYSRIANEVFAPLYPYYAGQILAQTGVRKGSCLDVGCGCGHLGLALAEMSEMGLCMLDQSQSMLELALTNARERDLSDRTEAVLASVEAIPLPDATFVLVISRGSIPFWRNLTKSFREIWRVLKPGGHAYIGGGLGSPEIRRDIERSMRERDPDWRNDMRRNIPQRSTNEYASALKEAGIPNFFVDRSEEGTWIKFQKT